MNIVYSSSDSYSECTGISLWSLLNYNKMVDDINIYILSTDISLANQKALKEIAEAFGRDIFIIDAKEDFISTAQQFNLPLMRGAYSTYSRICLNKWFYDLDKILVVDADTMICGPLSDLWDVDLTGKLIGAVPEVAMYGEVNHIEDSNILEGVDTYYNMGICLVNLKEWREKDIDSILKAKILEEKNSFMVADQSIINKYLNDSIVRIPLKYNYYSVVHSVKYDTIAKVFCKKEVLSLEEFQSASEDIRIIHYFGHPYERPWFRHNAAFRRKDYAEIRKKTPWRNKHLQKWSSSKNLVIRIYDICCYLLLLMGFRNTCLKFRYYYGQRIKALLGMKR